MTEVTCFNGEDGVVLTDELMEETNLSEIEKLMQEVELFRQAIEDAKDALASAELELATRLDIEYQQRQ